MSHLPFLGSLELCLVLREQRGLEALVEKKGRNRFLKMCVYLKSWCGERVSGTDRVREITPCYTRDVTPVSMLKRQRQVMLCCKMQV